jgi:hypothetical protein
MIDTKRNTDEKLKWKAQKAKLKLAFPKLTDGELNYDYSKKQEMLTKLAVKLGQTTGELLGIMESD